MNKKIYGFALVALLTLGLAASGAFAAAPMGQGGFMSFDSRDLIGAIVRTPRGNLVGLVSAMLNSDEGSLEAAPPFNPVPGNDRQYEADVYRYYGIQPYWTRSDECFTEGRISE